MAAVDIPKQYKAAVYDAPGTLSTAVETLETPDPGAGEVLVHLYERSLFYLPVERLLSIMSFLLALANKKTMKLPLLAW